VTAIVPIEHPGARIRDLSGTSCKLTGAVPRVPDTSVLAGLAYRREPRRRFATKRIELTLPIINGNQ
jgi:hypothetical protein